MLTNLQIKSPAGRLVDVTKNYKYMYLCCGSVVVLASVWLFIGNFINYRLLERERKQKQTSEQQENQEQTNADAEASQQLFEDQGGVVQRETNI